MEYYDSFDCQVQCEEVYPLLPGLFVEEDSEDIMDRCEVVSLEGIKHSNYGGSYRMEDDVIEADELDWLWDTNEAHRELEDKFALKKVYA